MEGEQHPSADPSEANGGSTPLSEAQRERIHRNREKAKAIRQARLASAPYEPRKTTVGGLRPYTAARPANPRPLAAGFHDTHGGYVLEEEGDMSQTRGYRVVEEDAPALPSEQEVCEECHRRFAESFLQSKFQLNVCDQCRDRDGKHKLITKTEAKERFLLQDGDFDERDGPALPYLLRKNPHGTWGDMKLYLICQVQSRSHGIWGGEEGLASEQERRGEAREKRKEKRYAKEIKDLRRAVQFSRTKTSSSSHEHSFTDETYSADTDTWTKTCSECGYQVTFEKM